MDVKNRGQAFKRTEDQKSIKSIINERLLNLTLTVQLPTLEEKKCKICKTVEKGILINFLDFIPPQGSMILTGFINDYYTEIEITVLEHIQKSYFLCKSNYLRISSQRRMEPRFLIDDEESENVYLKNIKISKNTLDIRGDTIPVNYRVLMNKYQTDYSHLGDEVHIESFSEKGELYQAIKKSGKTLFISDSRQDSSFVYDESTNQDLFNFKDFYGVNFQKEQKKLINQDKIGRVICPILGPVTQNQWIAIGYIEITSKNPIEFDKLMEVKTLCFELIDALRNSSILEIKDRQRILDVSKSGLRFETKNNELINTIMSRSQFICDIFIIHQAPITVKAWIRCTKKMQDGSLQIGVKIQGETNRQDQMLRYLTFIKELANKNKGEC